jgi:hypothetical protein
VKRSSPLSGVVLWVGQWPWIRVRDIGEHRFKVENSRKNVLRFDLTSVTVDVPTESSSLVGVIYPDGTTGTQISYRRLGTLEPGDITPVRATPIVKSLAAPARTAMTTLATLMAPDLPARPLTAGDGSRILRFTVPVRL